MKVVYTASARQDLEDIADWFSLHYPAHAPAIERHIRAVVRRIGRWPKSGRLSGKHPRVRTVPVGRYPYRIFYRVTAEAIEILHIHHAARQPWDEKEQA
ncbi:MAG: type II toxin-antitoxin system RelE/ParE family toxin [Bradyrhizobiaceae bacterium]|nr:type II toxin-antitoxin system RelE/ParE family toxin [Bradyrhizobiaceae bacterium]